LELLSELPERYGSGIHAYVLMANHFHVLLETREANLSRVGQWLNVSYSVWFNRRHRRSGHLFQGRFGAVLIEDDAGFQEVGRYLHLNPVRVQGLQMDKGRRAAGRRVGLAQPPSAEVVARRLATLRQWKWSSYRAYAGYCAMPEWLTHAVLGQLCGGRTRRERQEAMRTYTEQAVREGLREAPWERVIGGVVLGTEAFAERMRACMGQGNRREQAGHKRMMRSVGWEQIVSAVEKVKGEGWETFRDRHGDWGRDAALWLGRRAGRMDLRELAQRMGGVDYSSAGTAVSRFTRRLVRDRKLAQVMASLIRQLSNAEM
jgi:REP element-mobilizing transposase RayT